MLLLAAVWGQRGLIDLTFLTTGRTQGFALSSRYAPIPYKTKGLWLAEDVMITEGLVRGAPPSRPCRGWCPPCRLPSDQTEGPLGPEGQPQLESWWGRLGRPSGLRCCVSCRRGLWVTSVCCRCVDETGSHQQKASYELFIRLPVLCELSFQDFAQWSTGSRVRGNRGEGGSG